MNDTTPRIIRAAFTAIAHAGTPLAAKYRLRFQTLERLRLRRARLTTIVRRTPRAAHRHRARAQVRSTSRSGDSGDDDPIPSEQLHSLRAGVSK